MNGTINYSPKLWIIFKILNLIVAECFVSLKRLILKLIEGIKNKNADMSNAKYCDFF